MKTSFKELESPFLEELFVPQVEPEWEPRLAALEAESPFHHVFEKGFPTVTEDRENADDYAPDESTSFESEGAAAPSPATGPKTVVFVQGGKQNEDKYPWMFFHLAPRTEPMTGPVNLAFFDYPAGKLKIWKNHTLKRGQAPVAPADSETELTPKVKVRLGDGTTDDTGPDRASVLALYEWVKSQPKNSIRSLQVFSHGWQGGPIIWNSAEFDPAGNRLQALDGKDRDPNDTDFRIRDFIGSNPLAGAEGVKFAEAFTADAFIKLWGCVAPDGVRPHMQRYVRAPKGSRGDSTRKVSLQKYLDSIGNSFPMEMAVRLNLSVWASPLGYGSEPGRKVPTNRGRDLVVKYRGVFPPDLNKDQWWRVSWFFRNQDKGVKFYQDVLKARVDAVDFVEHKKSWFEDARLVAATHETPTDEPVPGEETQDQWKPRLTTLEAESPLQRALEEGGETSVEPEPQEAERWGDSEETFSESETGVIDGDNRVRVKNTMGVPWRWICKIAIEDDRGRPLGGGTGVLVSDRHVLTAAHVVHAATNDMQKYSILVIPALNYGDEPFGSYSVSSKPKIQKNYDPGAENHLDWDYALIKLDDAIGRKTFSKLNGSALCYWGSPRCSVNTFFGRPDPKALNGKAAFTAGYPGSKGGKQLWCAAGILHSVNPQRRTMWMTADTTKGQSGSPVWVKEQGKYCLVGVAAGAGENSNSLVRVTRELIDQVRAWINKDGETPTMAEIEELFPPDADAQELFREVPPPDEGQEERESYDKQTGGEGEEILEESLPEHRDEPQDEESHQVEERSSEQESESPQAGELLLRQEEDDENGLHPKSFTSPGLSDFETLESRKDELDLDETLESPFLEEETAPLIDGEAPIWRSGTEYYRDAASGRDQVGVQRDDGDVLLAVTSNGSAVTLLTSARAGTLQINPGRPVYRLRRAQLVAVAGGSAGALRARFAGPKVMALADGTVLLTEVLRDGKRIYEGVPSGELPETLRGQLAHGTRLEINQGRLRVWMVFRLRGESADTARWVPAKKTLAEVKVRRDTFTAAAARVPAGTLRSAIETHLDTLTVVSAIEGGFESKSGAGDTHASLGIFQWAMKRDQWQKTGSLGDFFRKLKLGAQAGNTDEAASLYRNAWAECTAQGLDVRQEGGRWVLSLNGSHATGSQVEARMHSAMAAGSLASYQLVAGLDWIRDFQRTVVWPGPLGARLLGHGWRVVEAPQKARLASGGRTLDIETTAVTRLFQVFTSQAALATAVMLGVNRPAFVALALWRALGTPGDPSARVGQLLDAIFQACDAAGQHPVNGRYALQHVNAAGAAAQAAWEALRVFLWPAASLPVGGEAELRAIFERKALWLYDSDDARKYKREGRFATVRVLLP